CFEASSGICARRVDVVARSAPSLLAGTNPRTQESAPERCLWYRNSPCPRTIHTHRSVPVSLSRQQHAEAWSYGAALAAAQAMVLPPGGDHEAVRCGAPSLRRTVSWPTPLQRACERAALTFCA